MKPEDFTLNKRYVVISDAPKEMSWEQYCQESIAEYKQLLSESSNDETVFQKFFERNPAFVPGALGLGVQSGHYPYMNTLISQPALGTMFTRIPDFMWLAQDSLHFCPVFIEIERPNKRMFVKGNTESADFNQAMGQIRQWKMILNNPTNIQVFYDMFDIPIEMRNKHFHPQYLLIYGRRSEYENDRYLTGLRYENQRADLTIMSYDRLTPVFEYRQFVTCKVKTGRYVVQHIPPTYRHRADCAEELYRYTNFYEEIDNMEKTTEERKGFLKDRFQYWCGFEGRISGMIISQEGE